MRRGLTIILLCMALLVLGGGAFALIPGARIGFMNDLELNQLLGMVLYFTAAIVGLMGMLSLRASCRALTRMLKDASELGELRPIPSPHPDLQQLVSAANGIIGHAKEMIGDAQLRTKELDIRLRIATAERQHAEAIIYSISDAVLVTDPFDDLVLANDAAAKTFSFDLANGRAPLQKVLSDARMVSLIREMRQSDSKAGRRVLEHQVADRTYKVTLSCVAPRGDHPAGVVAVLHDMTREKEVAQLKSDFVSHVSHELRTPLASIKAYVEMLIDGEASDDKTQAEFYEIIQNEANRLSRLIDNILNLSRIESGLVKTNKRPQSLTVVLKDAVEVIKPQAKQKQITVLEEIPPAIYQTLIDRDMLYEAVLNLLSNAVKYTAEGGRVTVRCVADEAAKKVCVHIVDTGVGIPPKDLPFVFDKFYRCDANSRMAKGTGLGLSLVKHIVEAVHQGRVMLESEVGKGSTFGFELDLVE